MALGWIGATSAFGPVVRKPKTPIVSSPVLTLPSSGAKRLLKRNCSKKALTACRSSSYTKLQSAEDRFITKGAL
jgi:hypothetical protein